MLLIASVLLGLEVDALRQVVALRPIGAPGLGRLALRGVPACGGRIDVEARFDAEGRPVAADVQGLPPGWRRVE